MLISRRLRMIYLAILSAVVGALAICTVVALAFVRALVAVDLSRTVAVFFILAMIGMICCLSLFLREVFLAVKGDEADRLLDPSPRRRPDEDRECVEDIRVPAFAGTTELCRRLSRARPPPAPAASAAWRSQSRA